MQLLEWVISFWGTCLTNTKISQIRKLLTNQYSGVYRSLNLYWELYGGWSAFFGSPYLHVAVLLSIINYPLWCWEYSPDIPWYDVALSMFPGLLSFTLGGYAVLLAFGGEKFLELISGPSKSGDFSPFLKINGALVHFIFLQGLSILCAFVAKTWAIDTGFFAWLGSLISLYALILLFPATLTIMRVAHQLDDFRYNTRLLSGAPNIPKHRFTKSSSYTLRTWRPNARRSPTKIN